MFERIYLSAMRHGSRLLFAIALVAMLTAIIQSFQLVGTLGPDNQPPADALLFASTLLSALSFAAMPLFGALILDRLDRWLKSYESDRV